MGQIFGIFIYVKALKANCVYCINNLEMVLGRNKR